MPCLVLLMVVRCAPFGALDLALFGLHIGMFIGHFCHCFWASLRAAPSDLSPPWHAYIMIVACLIDEALSTC